MQLQIPTKSRQTHKSQALYANTSNPTQANHHKPASIITQQITIKSNNPPNQNLPNTQTNAKPTNNNQNQTEKTESYRQHSQNVTPQQSINNQPNI